MVKFDNPSFSIFLGLSCLELIILVPLTTGSSFWLSTFITSPSCPQSEKEMESSLIVIIVGHVYSSERKMNISIINYIIKFSIHNYI